VVVVAGGGGHRVNMSKQGRAGCGRVQSLRGYAAPPAAPHLLQCPTNCRGVIRGQASSQTPVYVVGGGEQLCRVCVCILGGGWSEFECQHNSNQGRAALAGGGRT
jgi:hypothetical protein